jgi:hypothetical protein
MMPSVKHWLLGGWCPRWNNDYWADDALGERLTTGRMIPSVKHWLLGGWYPRWNTDYWADDTLGETLITGRMIPSVKHWLLGGWYPRRNTDYWADDTLGETLITGRMIPSMTNSNTNIDIESSVELTTLYLMICKFDFNLCLSVMLDILSLFIYIHSLSY